MIHQNTNTNTMINKKEIFNHISGINAKTSYGGDFEGYVEPISDIIATNYHNEVLAAIDNKESLAVKIMNGTSQTFSDKQLWVITFEVLKNAEYCAKIVSDNKERFENEARKKAAKKAAKKERKAGKAAFALKVAKICAEREAKEAAKKAARRAAKLAA